MGSRVRNVMTELHGEKIDIVDYSQDPAEFVAHALSPARVSRVIIMDAQARVAQVIVPDYQLSLAIGKEGQNARLAARLTGWRIDIRPDSPAGTEGPITSAGPEDAGRAAAGPSRDRPGQDDRGPSQDDAEPGQDDGGSDAELASAVSDAPGQAGTGPGAPDAQAL
jgi:N utilization substance protein A